jgi:hypothetical protein
MNESQFYGVLYLDSIYSTEFCYYINIQLFLYSIALIVHEYFPFLEININQMGDKYI